MTTGWPRRHLHVFPGWRRKGRHGDPARRPADPGAGLADAVDPADHVDPQEPGKPPEPDKPAEPEKPAGPAQPDLGAWIQLPAVGETETFDAFSALPDEPLTAEMAVLMVIRPLQEQGRPQFLLRGFCSCCAVMDFPGRYDRPNLALDSLASEEGELPATILSLMKSWSSTKPELNRWLARHGDVQDLVIWDNTGYRIPWELFWLDHPPGCKLGHPPSCKGDWLGGVITVARWLQIRTTSYEAERGYRSAALCTGPVMSCIAPGFSRDHLLLDGWRTETRASVRELANALETGGDPLSLVYVSCDGRFGEQISQCWLGDLSLVHFDSRRLSRLAAGPTFVFLNACHSGGLSHDTTRLNDGFLRGFAEVFLRSGAAGVLAASGWVSAGGAFGMAEAVLGRLREQPNVPVARIVRDLRAAAAARIPDDLASIDKPAAQRELLPALYTFMYVCYGSPRATVSPDLDGGTS
jgi:hypothetical protein